MSDVKPYRLMGIVNVTPDSFSDGGAFIAPEAAIAHGVQLSAAGADILDIGGESTRPGAEEVDASEELSRVIPVLEGLRARGGAALSIDTRKPAVARAAMDAGATIWNDVTALTYAEDSLQTARDLGCDVVLMHAQGAPKTMQNAPYYDDVVEEVRAFLGERIDACLAAGVAMERLIIDPGIGFGKTVEHNLALIANIDRLASLGPPVLFGASRKRFIATLDRDGPANERVGGSLAAVLSAARRGASLFRVHNVAQTRQALAVAHAIETAMEKPPAIR